MPISTQTQQQSGPGQDWLSVHRRKTQQPPTLTTKKIGTHNKGMKTEHYQDKRKHSLKDWIGSEKKPQKDKGCAQQSLSWNEKGKELTETDQTKRRQKTSPGRYLDLESNIYIDVPTTANHFRL